jgi:hypothetical protein
LVFHEASWLILDRFEAQALQATAGLDPQRTDPVRVRRRHVLHGTVILVVLVQLGFASGFLIDAAQTNDSYDALTAGRVALTGHVAGCALVGSTGRRPSVLICRVDYRYRTTTFSYFIPAGQSRTAFIDPRDPSIRMTKVDFEGGPATTTVDLVCASLLLFGATLVTTVHLVRLRRGRHRRVRPKAGRTP